MNLQTGTAILLIREVYCKNIYNYLQEVKIFLLGKDATEKGGEIQFMHEWGFNHIGLCADVQQMNDNKSSTSKFYLIIY